MLCLWRSIACQMSQRSKAGEMLDCQFFLRARCRATRAAPRCRVRPAHLQPLECKFKQGQWREKKKGNPETARNKRNTWNDLGNRSWLCVLASSRVEPSLCWLFVAQSWELVSVLRETPALLFILPFFFPYPRRLILHRRRRKNKPSLK